MLIKKKKGQSTVEYIILVTAVIAVIIFFVVNGDTSPFRTKMNQTLGNATDAMVSMASRLNGAFAAVNAAN